MRIVHQRFTIIHTRKPLHPTVNDELQWLGTSLGLFGERDKDKSAFRIFLELLKAAKRGHPLSSDELAHMLKLTRGTVVHHLNNLMESGLVVHDGKRYWLRDPRLENLLEELRRDMERTIDDLKRAAKEIDETLQL
jgi:predicted transcriptional regulator